MDENNKLYIRFHNQKIEALELENGVRIPDPGYYTIDAYPALWSWELVKDLPADQYREATPDEYADGIHIESEYHMNDFGKRIERKVKVIYTEQE